MADFLKAEQVDEEKWRLLAIPFGGPFDGKDLQKEFFSIRTDIKPRWFRERPVVFHHGKDPSMKDIDFGRQELDPEPEDDGWWSTVWLDRTARYWDRVNDLLKRGKMYGSSGTLGHFVRKNMKSGELLVWPHAEQTLTPIPVNPFSRLTATKAVADLEFMQADLRLDLPEDGESDMDDLSEGGEAAAKEHLDIRLKALEVRLKALR